MFRPRESPAKLETGAADSEGKAGVPKWATSDLSEHEHGGLVPLECSCRGSIQEDATPMSSDPVSMDPMIPGELRQLLGRLGDAMPEISARAEAVDTECLWPSHAMHALAELELLGLHVQKRLGGHEQGLLALTVFCETLGNACSSSALCFGMHSVATAVIAAKATSYQEEAFLRPIAQGRHLTTLALSEAGTGSHFFFPETRLTIERDHYRVDGEKHFVTNGGHADSYVLSTIGVGDGVEIGEFSCVLMEKDAPGSHWLEPWSGFGMRGNSSRGLRLESVRLPRGNLLGQEGDQLWYVFEIVAPYFLLAMAGTYLGIAEAALQQTIQDVSDRSYHHSGERLADSPVLQSSLAEMWTNVDRTRASLYRAATLGDSGDANALVPILAAKIAAAETAVEVTNLAMTLGGGRAYRENSRLARLLRDARASHVMAPTTHLLKQWIGRSLLGLPLL